MTKKYLDLFFNWKNNLLAGDTKEDQVPFYVCLHMKQQIN